MIVLPRLIFSSCKIAVRLIASSVVFTLCFATAGCDRIPTLLENKDRARDQAEQKQAAGDYLGAVNSYEKTLDGTAKTAEAHFRMALIYDEKLNDSLSAVYHFRRYLALQPSGSHVRDAKNNLGRLELTLATSLSSGTLISHAEAMRLRNENVELRKQMATKSAGVAFTQISPVSNPPGTSTAKSTETGRNAQKGVDRKAVPGARAYQVQPGDTLASISRKFYKTRDRAKDIQGANMNSIPDAARLKPGQTIIIP